MQNSRECVGLKLNACSLLTVKGGHLEMDQIVDVARAMFAKKKGATNLPGMFYCIFMFV